MNIDLFIKQENYFFGTIRKMSEPEYSGSTSSYIQAQTENAYNPKTEIISFYSENTIVVTAMNFKKTPRATESGTHQLGKQPHYDAYAATN